MLILDMVPNPRKREKSGHWQPVSGHYVVAGRVSPIFTRKKTAVECVFLVLSTCNMMIQTINFEIYLNADNFWKELKSKTCHAASFPHSRASIKKIPSIVTTNENMEKANCKTNNLFQWNNKLEEKLKYGIWYFSGSIPKIIWFLVTRCHLAHTCLHEPRLIHDELSFLRRRKEKSPNIFTLKLMARNVKDKII